MDPSACGLISLRLGFRRNFRSVSIGCTETDRNFFGILISTRLRTTQKFDLWQFLTTFKTNAKDCMSLLLYANKVYSKLIADTYIIYKKYLTKMI